MTRAAHAAIVEFAEGLRSLRRRAGEPSLNWLATLTTDLPHPLPRSTISDKLNARSLPDWEFVAAFVHACAAYASQAGAPLPAEAVDLSQWSGRHVRMLRAVDTSQATERLATAARAEIERRTPEPVVPRQLPAAPRHFTGREAALAALDRIALKAAAPGGAVVVFAVGGTAGVGKTTLAVHWAHRAADRFPDGHLYVNLRGYGPGTPLAPGEAIRGFLEAFAVPARAIPTTLDGQAGLYRSLLAGKRMLVLLDNARDAEQVRPLLPGSAGCLAIVTSRDRLAGLVTVEGAHPLPLELLTSAESRALLAERVGPQRVRAEPEAVDRVVAACTGLPLALAIVAARATAHPGFRLADLAAEVTGARGLDAFAGGDRSADVRGVLSWSYRALDPAAARLFRLLSRHPGPDIGTAAAASLAALPPREASRLLRGLADAHLVVEQRPGRFARHDLLRAYAAELCAELDGAEERRAATHRLLDHYLRTADRAAQLVDPYRTGLEPPEPPPGVTPEEIADATGALAWFAAEHRGLVAVVVREEAGFDAYTHRLARALWAYLYLSGHWHDWTTVEEVGSRAARRSGDLREQAHAHHGLARVYLRLNRREAALTQLRLALSRYTDIGDEVGRAHIHLNLARAFDQFGEHETALRHGRLALDAYRTAGNTAGQATALTGVGRSLSRLGQHREAVGNCDAALDLQLRLGDHNGAADTLDTLGHAYHRLRDHESARACYRRAVDMFRQAGNQPEECLSLDRLGDVLAEAGDAEGAQEAWRRAAELHERAGRAEPLAAIRDKLGRVDRSFPSALI